MKLLQEKILKEGRVLPGNILKVDGFLNQQLDITLIQELGKEFAKRFENMGVNKILTVESSGIGIACIAAQYMNNVPVVFGKKHKTLKRGDEFYATKIFSFTHNREYEVTIAKQFISSDDVILIIDDFLANGEAVHGLMDIIDQAGATLAGVGIAVEKGFQGGGDALREKGIKVESLAIVDSMTDTTVTFR
jgi:xanthine phosphoribosyltransferase